MKFQSLVLLGLSIATIGTSMMLGAATPASAKDIKAEPILKNGDAQGSLMSLGSVNWKEAKDRGETTFIFKETGHNDGSVYLLDPSGNITLQLDSHRQMVGVRVAF
jgi:hypothetical protein